MQADNVMGYWGLVLPSSLGGVSDLAHDAALGNLVKKFVAASSTFDLRSSRLLPVMHIPRY
jgi:hypothetical protein